MSRTSLLCGWLAAVAILPARVAAQADDYVTRITLGTVTAGQPLRIEAELVNTSVIDHIECTYRVFGQSEFKRLEMPVTGNSAVATIPGADVIPPFVEYYLVVATSDGGRHTYPLENAADHPVRIDVAAGPARADEAIIILSPDPDELVDPENALVSVSLLRADSSVARERTKVLVDGADLSAQVVVSGDLVLLDLSGPAVPLAPGPHAIAVELYDARGRLTASAGWNFRSRGYADGTGPAPATAPRGAAAISRWVHRATVQAETRSEDISGVSTPYNRLTAGATSTLEQYRFTGNLYLTNEEKDYRQPQHRYYVGAEAPWGKAGYGDTYPALSELVLSGRRVRGLNARGAYGAFALDVVAGDIVRNVEGDTLETFPADSLAIEQARYPASGFVLYDPAAGRWARVGFGTFSRNLLAVRPTFGSPGGARIAFTYLKSKDDIGSIRFGSRPQENLVLGSDFYVPVAGRTLELAGQVAMSATNRDITGGTFSDADIDSVFSDYAQYQRDNIRKARDILQRFITVNENLVPLAMKNLPTLAWETSLGLNTAGGHTFKATYLRRGNSYESFGQPFIRTDVQGFSLSGLVRLPDREVTLTGALERLQDNTADTKAATTTGWTASTSVSYNPFSRELPTATFGYLYAANTNDIPSDTAFGVDDGMHRFMLGLGRRFALAGGEHAATFGGSISTRDDRSPRDADTRTTSLTLADAVAFAIPLQATVSATFNTTRYTTAPGSQRTASYTTIYANAQYRLLDDRLRLAGTLSPTFGDLERTLVDGRAQYYLLDNLSALFQLSLYFNASGGNDTILSFILRADV